MHFIKNRKKQYEFDQVRALRSEVFGSLENGLLFHSFYKTYSFALNHVK